MSEVWRRVLLGVKNLNSHRAAWSWMTTIGINALRSMGRNQQRADRRSDAVEREAAADPAVVFLSRIEEDLVEDHHTSAALSYIARLPTEDQELIRLVADEIPHIEIAKRLGLRSAAASRQRLRRIRIAIQAGMTH
jgi:DNA-directed RNA polymerase specialized sigma24 family protein